MPSAINWKWGNGIPLWPTAVSLLSNNLSKSHCLKYVKLPLPHLLQDSIFHTRVPDPESYVIYFYWFVLIFSDEKYRLHPSIKLHLHAWRTTALLLISLASANHPVSSNYSLIEQDPQFTLTNYIPETVASETMTYVAKKSTMTGVWLCSTRSEKSLSSWIVTIWLDDVTGLVWRKTADCFMMLDDKRLFCVEIKFVDGFHVDNSLTGMHLDLRSSCLLTCNVALDAIAETKRTNVAMQT